VKENIGSQQENDGNATIALPVQVVLLKNKTCKHNNTKKKKKKHLRWGNLSKNIQTALGC